MLTVAAFRDDARLRPPVRLAIRAGLLSLVAAQIAGGVMIATGMQLVFGGELQRAYATGGWLKPVHGALMHGVLALPLLAWLLSTTDWEERPSRTNARPRIPRRCEKPAGEHCGEDMRS